MEADINCPVDLTLASAVSHSFCFGSKVSKLFDTDLGVGGELAFVAIVLLSQGC